ncbi:MAG: aspartate aminotransferase family protein, partial [Acidobacteria bacterium]|nr:aspartate aminotransferase family protein [Acidobacteriota bacterium]
LVCFRLNDGRPEEELDELNQTLLERLNASGKLLMTQTRLRGQYVLRLSIGARLTETRHVEEAWQLIDAFARDLITTGA